MPIFRPPDAATVREHTIALNRATDEMRAVQEIPAKTKAAACETWDYIAPQAGIGTAAVMLLAFVLKVSLPTVTAWVRKRFGPKDDTK